MEEQVIRLDELFEALKKRWLMIVSITLIATIASAVFSFFIIKPQYEASTKVFIGKDESDNQSYSQNDVLMYQKLMKTYSEAIKTKDLISRGLKGTSLDLEPSNVLNNLTVVTVADTQILQIKYKSKNPEEVKTVIDKVSDEFIKTSKELVPNGNIKIIEAVELPDKPVSPNKKMNIAIAFLLGLMVGVGLAFLLEFLDNTFKNKEQLEREFEIPVIGLIPKIKES
ncbi:Wzz/FepE/Etk N-terminal domain-containing protein [Clostridium sp. AL.422]|uniref:YveK family protein n=1 Tax=Clostridium TaxID=1485 RepID=UPI00293DF5D5|nr:MULTISPECIES: Wzz/FepE/Etk N-terminal domain-containing protein [unclassified Clostridium]MDV4150299.1 Wzz/FepE/Etk N-terminal domain-containing protein [Clostridium sp. AL.422]